MDRDEFINFYKKITREVQVMALATWSGDSPWAADIFFAPMGADLVFFSSSTSNHCKHLVDTPKVAAAIHSQAVSWKWITGIQLTGTCAKVESSIKKTRCMAAYYKKYQFAKEIITDAASISRNLADKISRVKIYLIQVDRVVVTDNTREFGEKFVMDVVDGQFVGQPSIP